MRFFKKFLVRIAAVAVTALCSSSVLAQNYIIKTAFVGEPGLKKFVVGKIFDKDHQVFEDAFSVCGVRLTTPIDSILYKFRAEALNMSQLRDAALRECDLVFMIADFSSPKTNLNDILTKGVEEACYASQGKSKVIVIAMNTRNLSEDNLKKFNDACGFYGKGNFGYILTSSDEDDEAFRNRLFEVTERMIDWRRLPPSIESNGDIISRLELLRTIESNPGNQPVITLARQMIRKDNRDIALKFRIDAMKECMAHLGERTAVLEQDVAAAASDIKNLKLTVEELDSIRDLQSRLNGLTRALGELSTLLHGMSAGRPFNADEAQHICDRIDASMRNLDVDEEGSSADGEAPGDEIKKILQDIRDLRQIVADNRAAINAHEQLSTRFQSYMDEETEAQKSLLADRTTWLQKAAKIQHYVDELKKDEEYIGAVCEGKIKEFDWEQYNKCKWFGKWLARTTRPYIKDREKRKKLLEKQKEITEELKKLDEGEKPKTPKRESDKGEKREKPEKELDESGEPKKD